MNGASAWPTGGFPLNYGHNQNAYNASLGLPTGLRSNSSSTSESGFDSTAKAISDRQFGNAYSQAGSLGGNIGNLYSQARNNLGSLFSGVFSGLQGLGENDRARINRSFNAQRGAVGQGTANNGLYNTTVRQNMQQGVERNRAEALGQLDDSVRQQNLAVLLQQLQALSGLDQANIGAQQQIGLQGLGFLGEMARTFPNYSRSNSTSLSR